MAKVPGAEAFQMFLPESLTAHPVIDLPPERMGWAPDAACQVTVWPFVPESAAVKTSGDVSRYVPSASSTTRSLFIVLAALRTTLWAWVIEQGAALVQVVPVPVGET